jgi:hydrogenase-4 component B
MTIGQLLTISGASLVAGIIFGPRFSKAWLVFTLLGMACSLGAALSVLAGIDWEWLSGFPLGGELLHFRLDGLSALFLVLLSIAGGAGAIYARGYWPDRNYASAPRGRAWWCGILLSMGLVLISSNGLHFLIAWELFTVCSYFLITLDRQHREVRTAGWLFLVSSHAGTVCLFAFFGMLAARTGSWELGPMHEHARLAPLFWLALAGFGVKAGLFPLHVWLPSAHANAPSHVSAIMSGVAIKMGIYGLVRFSGWMPLPQAAGWIVIFIGAASALLGIGCAFAQTDLKRLLAYCSVENIGIILIGLGAALLGSQHGQAPWVKLALAGALLHIWNHGLFKSLLFFGAGSVLHATGTRDMSRLGGLWRRMPWTTGLFLIGSLAVSGLPPLNGFVSEWLVYLGLFNAATSRSVTLWAAMPATVALAMAGALALASFSKASAMVFLGAARTRVAEKAHESGALMLGPMVLFAVICITLGLAPAIFWPAISRAVGTWNPALGGVDSPAPLASLGSANIALALVACGGGVWMWRKAASKNHRRSLTWDCGYASPSARMQYTSGAFAGIASGWFFWFLRPELKMRRPRGPFPARASRIQAMPDPVMERVILPVTGVVIRISAAVRRLQHGRLQAYIFYVTVALAALGLLTWMMSMP